MANKQNDQAGKSVENSEKGSASQGAPQQDGMKNGTMRGVGSLDEDLQQVVATDLADSTDQEAEKNDN